MNTLSNFRYAAIGFFLFLSSLGAEVQEVIIRWNPYLCQQSCIRGLEERFKKVPGVDSVELNQPGGFAKLTWKKRIPFSFQPLNYALRYIGLREKDVRVKVRGYVAVYQDIYSLVSTDDHTRFVLFNRASSSPNQYVVEFNPANRVLSAELKEQLTEYQRNNTPIVIEGSLFMPQRSPPDPLQLIVGTINAEEDEEAPSPIRR